MLLRLALNLENDKLELGNDVLLLNEHTNILLKNVVPFKIMSTFRSLVLKLFLEILMKFGYCDVERELQLTTGAHTHTKIPEERG